MANTGVSSELPVDPSVLISKRVVFVGGLADEATTQLVRAAFIPFGDIKVVDMPMDYVKGTVHRGFSFVEFEDPDDAEEAIFNMDGADLLGRTISVSLAQPNQLHKLSSGAPNRSEAVWKSDEWFQQQVGMNQAELAKQKELEADGKALQEH
jgi:peptidyl-prolyl isomerase E (cyclophilin E)